MSRPATKKDLAIAAQERFDKLWELIDTTPQEIQQATFAFEDRDKHVRDILVHLYEWHQLLLSWVNSNLKGEEASFLPAPYNWKTYPGMNVKFWEKHQGTPYKQAKEMVTQSHEDIMKLIETFTNEELFEKKHYDWSGTTNIGTYFVSATSSHYDWAIKKFKQHVKTYQG